MIIWHTPLVLGHWHATLPYSSSMIGVTRLPVTSANDPHGRLFRSLVVIVIFIIRRRVENIFPLVMNADSDPTCKWGYVINHLDCPKRQLILVFNPVTQSVTLPLYVYGGNRGGSCASPWKWGRLGCRQTVRETLKNFVPVGTSSVAHKLLISRIFRSVVVHTKRKQF